MSFLTTLPEELLAAQGLLRGINSNLAAQNAGAAAATTVIAPAAADPVSVQQAAIFSAYGTQYQTIAAEAQTHSRAVCRAPWALSSGTYSATEAANAAQAAFQVPLGPRAARFQSPRRYSNTSSVAPATTAPALGGPFGLSSNAANIFNIGGGNWASAGSDLLGLAGGGLLNAPAADAAAAADLAGTTAPAAGWRPPAAWPAWARCRWPRVWPGEHGRQVVGAAELGRARSPRSAAPALPPLRDRGLDRRCAAGRRRDDRPGDAGNGRGRAQQRRLRCAALRRQAHRHAEADGRLVNTTQPNSLNRNGIQKMVLDFAAIPPEITSSLMYAGAGAGPLMAAATAWHNLAAELSTTATQWESIITMLTTEQWTGAGRQRRRPRPSPS